MRADALKNRGRILEAAESTFASLGLSVPIDVVAERAGVGVGTLYRHFPTKEALFEAIVMTRLDELVHDTKTRIDAADAADALFAFLRRFANEALAKADLFDAMNAAGFDIKSRCAEMVDELKRGIEVLVARADAAGAIRPDITADEVMSLISGTCMAARQSNLDDESCQRMVQIVCDGMRLPESRPLARS
ncbi:MAG TPA: helix-turn-helix domain-containing protein [Acidothermaceae bacterium]|jgi:AcrR family transcriptional regulator|nr:helix-turn-helix domain-containing protein [Acidothermaceae bacterium]